MVQCSTERLVFGCETACPLKRVLFNFLSEQEVRITESSSCLPLFTLQNSKFKLPPSIPSRLLFPLCKWQGGRSKGGEGGGGGGSGGPEPPHFLFACFVVPLFWYNNNFWENLPKRSETTIEI